MILQKVEVNKVFKQCLTLGGGSKKKQAYSVENYTLALSLMKK